MGEVDSSRHHDFNLSVVGGLGWMKWLKNGAGKCLYFMQFKVPLYSLCLNLNHEKTK